MGYESYKPAGYLVLNTFKSFFSTPLTVEELAKKISSSPAIIGQLGNQYELTEIGPDGLETAMRKLAARAGGRIPDSSSFFNAMKAEQDSDFTYVLKFTANAVAEDIGETLGTWAAFSRFLFKSAPYLAAGVVVWKIYETSKKIKES